jgi:hypothetical protein
MKKYRLIAIMKDPQATRWMQNAGVFESFKVIAHADSIEIELKEGDTLAAAISRLRDSFKGETKIGIVAAFVPGEPEGAWYDKSVKVVSNGKGWAMLKDILAANKWAGPEVTND